MLFIIGSSSYYNISINQVIELFFKRAMKIDSQNG